MSFGQMLFLPKYANGGAVNGIVPDGVRYSLTVTQFPFGRTLYWSTHVTISCFASSENCTAEPDVNFTLTVIGKSTTWLFYTV